MVQTPLQADLSSLFEQCVVIWMRGGWLMLPLLALTIFIYYTALELWLRLQGHFIIRSRAHRLSDDEISRGTSRSVSLLRELLLLDSGSPRDVRRHFAEVRHEYLPVINRRIRFLAIIITTGPLIGLLGTVTGMLSTFRGMVSVDGSKFENIVFGISEALVTTQTGLIISIPAFIILSLIIHRRNTLLHCLARLERYNTRRILIQPTPAP
jgi:biopolymer transport protein ExbB